MAFQQLVEVLIGLNREVSKLASLGVQTSKQPVAGDLGARTRDVVEAMSPEILEGLTPEELVAGNAFVRMGLRQALDLVEDPGRAAHWDYKDPLILDMQGRASAVVARMIAAYAKANEHAGALLSSSEARFLDVGSGAGWISLTLAQAFPGLTVDGIDIHQPSLTLAEKNLSETGLGGRVAFQKRNVLDVSEVDKWSAIWLPLFFLPEDVARQAVATLAKALKPNGILFLGNFRRPDDALATALVELQVARWGGTVWSKDALVALAKDHGLGFESDAGDGGQTMVLAMKKARMTT